MPDFRPILLAALLACSPALAQRHGPAEPMSHATMAERAAKRWPQPVRTGDLPGRYLLEPVPWQTVLGRVAGLARTREGTLLVVVNAGGLLGYWTRPVAVPVEAVALLGEHVALLDLTPAQLSALPTFDASGTAPVPPDELVRIGLTRPFH